MAADGDDVLYPKELTTQVEYESELVIVIGKTARYVSEAEAMDYVFGFTIGNDVTARDLQHPDNQWGVCKGFDTFGPFGPCGVRFGISPQGNNSNNLNSQYVDVEEIAQKGYADYICPQMYFGFQNSGCPYESTIKDFNRR